MGININKIVTKGNRVLSNQAIWKLQPEELTARNIVD